MTKFAPAREVTGWTRSPGPGPEEALGESPPCPAQALPSLPAAQGGWGHLLEVTQQVKTQGPKFPVLVLFSQTSVLPGATGGHSNHSSSCEVATDSGFSVQEARGSAGDCDKLESPGPVPGDSRSSARSRNMGPCRRSTCFCKPTGNVALM